MYRSLLLKTEKIHKTVTYSYKMTKQLEVWVWFVFDGHLCETITLHCLEEATTPQAPLSNLTLIREDLTNSKKK